MNAVEIEEAITLLAEEAFESDNFPYALLEAFGNKATTIKRLRSGSSNASDVDGAVLQRNNIHMMVCDEGEVTNSLKILKASSATIKSKAKFILTTDGIDLEAEDVISGETIACSYKDFPNHFGFFLPLAGITTVKQIRNNPIDIQATGRLNRLYIELLRENEDWSSNERRHDMNQFMTRLVFCFFAEDTEIFCRDNLFTATIEQMSDSRSENTQFVISELFRAMDIPIKEREAANLPRWASDLPYVNGGLFSGNHEVPKFSRIARSYLIHAGNLNWKEINPDIFGSMIQAIADDEERGELGMHYTSVPNILKLLNPLFLDSLREQLKEASDNSRKLLNLRKRIAKIRVFDPACGSGNFLVIAYKEMRAIENEINIRRKEIHQKSEIPLTNYRGIELRDFPAEIARLALIIAEYQCDVLYLGQKDALAEFLPLNAMNWITCGNALKLDWLSVCPPTGKAVKLLADDLFDTPLEQAEIDFENEGGETYICGNPPYIGSSLQSKEQKSDLELIFKDKVKGWKSLDYVAGWFIKASEYGKYTNSASAFVSTNSICQGQQVPILWPLIYSSEHEISFAHTSFKWSNLASNNAGVTVAIIGISNHVSGKRKLFSIGDDGNSVVKECDNINAYLVPADGVFVNSSSKPLNGLHPMDYGSKPADGGNLVLSIDDMRRLELPPELTGIVLPYIGSTEFIDGKQRFCLWVDEDNLEAALKIPQIAERIDSVKTFRSNSTKKPTMEAATRPHAFVEIRYGSDASSSMPFVVPIHTSENREYLPVGILPVGSVVSNAAFGIYDAPLWSMSLIASKLHLVWVATVCGKIKTDYRYSNKLGWNTFPLPQLTEKNKVDLTRCAENILLAREAHYPATIAELYAPEKMPENLRHAHERNDEVLERIYIGRRFKNDTERLEKLFELYTKMTTENNKTTKKEILQ